MTSINTNLSSIILQNSLTNSTNGVNKAIERMTTGFKLNYAKDNAAGYSIANNMSSKISSYDVAISNISAGLDLVATAQDTISLMQQHGERIHALITQAHNGTYSGSSLDAINSEISARMAEIDRLYNTTEYGGKNILQGVQLPDWTEEVKATAATTFTDSVTGEKRELKAQANGFIDSIVTVTPDIIVESASELEDAINNNTIIGIANADVLAELAKIVNGTDGYTANNCTGKTITLTDDVDLSSYQTGAGWTPIGNNTNKFAGTFDGQGHKILNLKINYTGGSNSVRYGLFGEAAGSAKIKNTGIVDAYVKGQYDTGVLAGAVSGSASVQNCYATGTVIGRYITGGLVGSASKILNSYADVNVTANNGYTTGGLIGYGSGAENCYSTGNVKTNHGSVGGLIGSCQHGVVKNCYSTSDVVGTSNVGGLCGDVTYGCSNSYATGNVTGTSSVGGLIGSATLAVDPCSNCYSTGNVKGTSSIGGIIGNRTLYTAGPNGSITSCFSTGDIKGQTFVGGVIGRYNVHSSMTIDKVCSLGDVSSTNSEPKAVGYIIGGVIDNANGTKCSNIKMQNISSAQSGKSIGGVYSSASGNPEVEYDMSTWLSNISVLPNSKITTQVGIFGDEASSMTFDCAFSYDLSAITKSGAQSSAAYESIINFMNILSSRSTSLGSISRSLESALESNSVAIDNLTSSLSTVRDADIAKESSAYIRQQILQQASATLLATANQTPAIALQLI